MSAYRTSDVPPTSVLPTVNGHFWMVCRFGRRPDDHRFFYTCLWCGSESIDILVNDRRPRWERIPLLLTPCPKFRSGLPGRTGSAG